MKDHVLEQLKDSYSRMRFHFEYCVWDDNDNNVGILML